MQVLRIIFMRTLRRPRIKLERWIVQFLVPDLAGIEAGYGKLPHQAKKPASIFFARARFVLISQRLEQCDLLLGSEFDKRFALGTFAVSVQPAEPSAIVVLSLRIARDHKVNKLRDSRLLRTRSCIGRNDDFRQPFYGCILRGAEELRTIRR